MNMEYWQPAFSRHKNMNPSSPHGMDAVHAVPQPSCSEIISIVNRLVNNGIDLKQSEPQIDDPWTIAPKVGWCHDYAVS
jgi:hypothetical protein